MLRTRHAATMPAGGSSKGRLFLVMSYVSGIPPMRRWMGPERWLALSMCGGGCAFARRTQMTTASVDVTSSSSGDAALLEVSELLLPEEEEGDEPMKRRNSGRSGGDGGDDGSTTDHSFDVITSLDLFARAKVLNFIQRYHPTNTNNASPSQSPPSTGQSSSSLFQTRKVHTFDGSFEFISRLRLPFDSAVYGERFGEGCADNEKDAEVVAAMHAERIIDALGFHMYLLASKQTRHAEAALKAGRWAPMPGGGADTMPPPNTPSPPSLQLRPANAQKLVDERLNDDERRYMLVTPGASSIAPLKLTLASKTSLDTGSVTRVRQFIEASGFTMVRSMRCVPLHALQKRETVRKFLKQTTDVARLMRRVSGVGSPPPQQASRQRDEHLGGDGRLAAALSDPSGAENWLVQIHVPLPEAFGHRVASGRGPDKKTAIACACMHAELIIDCLGVPLYLNNAAAQKQHADECSMVGRWATDCVDLSKSKVSETSPPPLRYAAAVQLTRSVADAEVFTAKKGNNDGGGGSDGTTELLGDAAAASGAQEHKFEHTLAIHSSAVRDLEHVIRLPTIDGAAMRDIRQFLARHLAAMEGEDVGPSSGVDHPSLQEEEEESDSGDSDWRHRVSSLFLTQPLGAKGRETFRTTLTVPLPETIEVWYDTPPLRRKKRELVAIGIGPSEQTSEACCAMHALQLLGTLGIPVYTSDGEQAAFAARIRHLGGTAVPSVMAAKPLAGQTKDASWSRSVERCAMKYVGTAGSTDNASVGRVVCPGSVNVNEQLDMETSKHYNEPSVAALHKRLQDKVQRARVTNPRAVWSLDADYPTPPSLSDARPEQPEAPPASACILLHPTASSERWCHKFRFALGSVRVVDGSALERAQDYMERHGIDIQQRWIITSDDGVDGGGGSSVSTTSAAAAAADRHLHGGGGAQEALVVAKLRLPVPIDAGVRIAIGRGTSRAEAQILCAMHMEVLLGHIGVPLFDYNPLQRRHAELVASFGRRAPVDNSACREWMQAPSPPPLVKPWESSTLWLRFLRHAVGINAQIGKNDAARLFRWDPHHSVVLPKEAGGGDSSISEEDDDGHRKEMKLIASMQTVAEGSIAPVLRNYLAAYFARVSPTGLDNLEAELRISQRAGPTGHPIYHATLPLINFPEEFRAKFEGQCRVAHACASTRRNAFFLCAMHAVHVLDALGIPLFDSWGKQGMHADFQQSRGWWAARNKAESDSIAATVPTPVGLKCLELGADVTTAGSLFATEDATTVGGRRSGGGKIPTTEDGSTEPLQDSTHANQTASPNRSSTALSAPMAPDHSALTPNQSTVLWTAYVKQCRAFLSSRQDMQWYDAAMVHQKAPRTGDPLPDEGLEVVEALRVDSHAKGALRQLCVSLQLPPPERFDVVHFGRHPHKMFIAHQTVNGTPFTALGVGPDNFTAVGRAAMHYTWIAHRVHAALMSAGGAGRGQQPLVQGVATPIKAGRASSVSTSANAGVVTDDQVRHVLAILKLYAASNPPGAPVLYQFRERPHPSGSVVHICTAEILDDTSLRVTAKAESTTDANSAKGKALVELHKLLMSKLGLQSLTHWCAKRFAKEPSKTKTGGQPNGDSAGNGGGDAFGVDWLVTTISLPTKHIVRERLAEHISRPLPLDSVEDGNGPVHNAVVHKPPPRIEATLLSPMLRWLVLCRDKNEHIGAGGAENNGEAPWVTMCVSLGLFSPSTPTSSSSSSWRTNRAGHDSFLLAEEILKRLLLLGQCPAADTTERRRRGERQQLIDQWIDGIRRSESAAELLTRCASFLITSAQLECLYDAVRLTAWMLSAPPSTTPGDLVSGRNSIDCNRATNALRWLMEKPRASPPAAEGDSGDVGYAMMLEVVLTSLAGAHPNLGRRARMMFDQGRPELSCFNAATVELAFLCAFGRSPTRVGFAEAPSQQATGAAASTGEEVISVTWLSVDRRLPRNSTFVMPQQILKGAGQQSSQGATTAARRRRLFCASTRGDEEHCTLFEVQSPWLLWFAAARHGPGRMEWTPEVPNLRMMWEGRAFFACSMDDRRGSPDRRDVISPAAAAAAASPRATIQAGEMFMKDLDALAGRFHNGLQHGPRVDDLWSSEAQHPIAMSLRETVERIVELTSHCTQFIMADGAQPQTSTTGRPQHCVGRLLPVVQVCSTS